MSITNSYFEGLAHSMLYVWRGGNNIKFKNNRIFNIKAQDVGYPLKYLGYAATTLNSWGEGIELVGNSIFNYPNYSFVGDLFNVFQSGGTEYSHIKVANNQFLGAGSQGIYDIHGAYLQIGDHLLGEYPGNYTTADNNVGVFVSWLAINNNGSHHVNITSNHLFSGGEVFGFDPDLYGQNNGGFRETEPGTMIQLWNYQNDDIGSYVNIANNNLRCDRCGLAVINNVDSPPHSKIEYNQENDTTLSPKRMIHQNFMDKACGMKTLYWSVEGKWCSRRVNAQDHQWSKTLADYGGKGFVYASCVNREWHLYNPSCG